MRIDALKFCSLTLAALLAAGPGWGQAAPAAPAPPQPPAPPAAPAVPRIADGDQVSIGRDRTVAKGEVVDGDIAHLGGDLRVAGTVRGDVGLVGGDLVLEPGGVITGDVGVAGGDAVLGEGSEIQGELAVKGGEIRNQGGRVAGEMRTEGGEAPVARASTEPRAEAREESWFAPIGRALGGIVSTVAVGLVLAGVGAALIFYGLPYLQTVSDTVRVSTLRSAGVGLAATFLIIPAYVVLLVMLAVSIVGIPLIIVAAPLYPLAVIAAISLGLLAAAHAIGERTAEQRDPLDLRFRNSYAYLFSGIGLLLAPIAGSFLLGMTGFLGFASVLLAILAGAAIWAATTVGLGAVILSRAGTRRLFAERFEMPQWQPDPLLDEDPLAADRRA